MTVIYFAKRRAGRVHDVSPKRPWAATARISEKARIQFRAEFFNLLNRSNFGTPNAVVFTAATTTPSPTAGVIGATSTTSRQIQFGLKLLW